MPYQLRLNVLECNDAQERTDEPYLRVNGHIVWGPHSMRTGREWTVNRRVDFDHDVVVELRESDRRRVPHRRDDHIGTMSIPEPEVRMLIRGDRGGPLSHTFRRDRGIVGDARYTLTYDLHEA